METNRPFVLKALTRILRPLVKILIHHGVSYKACSEAMKWCFVDVATREFAIEGKRQTKSRVAVITGLTWIEVSRLQAELEPSMQGEEEHYHRSTKVLTAWAEDERYQDEQGKALDIPLDGADISFAGLVNDYSGGATLKSVLNDVLHNGAVEEISKGFYRLLNPFYLTTYDKDRLQSIGVLGLSAGELISTIEHNIQPEQDSPRFQRVIFQRNLPTVAVSQAQDFIRCEAQILADKVDCKLAALAKQHDNPLEDNHTSLVGLGLYYFQSSKTSGPST